jgi:hypothetical protein
MFFVSEAPPELDTAPESSHALGVPFFGTTASVDAAIAACGTLPPVISGSTNLGAPATRTVNANGVAYQIAEQRRELVNDVTEHAFLQDLGAAGVYPGAVTQGRALSTGDVAPVGPLKRAPGTITVVTDIVGGNPRSQSRHVDKVDLSSITQARQALLKDLAPQDSAGLLKAEFQQAQTMREVAAKLGISVKGSTFGVDANAALNEEYKQSTVVAVIRQVFYTVAFTPADPGGAGVFDASVKASALKRYIGVGNPPLFIDSVHYGRFICLTVQGAHSSSEITAALKASWDTSVNVGVDLDVRSKEILNSSSIKLFTIGVPGGTNFQTLQVSLKELDRVFKEGLKLSASNPGAPIAFTCRHVVDSTLAHVGVAATYIQPISASAQDVESDVQVWDGPSGGLVDTGIDIAPGDQVSITASGRIWCGIWGAGDNGPEGWPGHRADSAAPLPSGTAFCLVMRFGMASWQEAKTFWQGTNESGQTGRLQLSSNDNNLRNGDDKKRWSVHIRVVRRNAQAAGIFV